MVPQGKGRKEPSMSVKRWLDTRPWRTAPKFVYIVNRTDVPKKEGK